MIATATSLHEKFLSLLPQIESHANFAFRKFPEHEREEAVAEVVASAWASFLRLTRRGKNPCSFPTALAKYAALAVKAGKLVGCPCNRRDLVSPFRKKPEGFRVISIHRASGNQQSSWKEILVEDKRATPAETAASRIDFAGWLRLQNRRDRKIAESLAAGNRPLDVARRFKVSPTRISQIREEFRQSWKAFHGEADEKGCRAELAVA